MSGGFEYSFKYIIIGALLCRFDCQRRLTTIAGDMGVGKSCLLHQFTERKFHPDAPHTIGVEFGTRVVDVLGTHVKLQIWDTAGQERFRSVTKSYYRGAAGVLLVYDITRRSSFNHVSGWLTDAKNLTNPKTVVMLIGNKADLHNREVSYDEAQRFADENGCIFLETSAKSGDNVEECFIRTARTILQQLQSGSVDVDPSMYGIQPGSNKAHITIMPKHEPPPGGYASSCAC